MRSIRLWLIVVLFISAAIYLSHSTESHQATNAPSSPRLSDTQALLTAAKLSTPSSDNKTVNQGIREFVLRSALKGLFDQLIHQAQSDDISVIKAMISDYCHDNDYSLQGCQQLTDLYRRYVDYKFALQSAEYQGYNVASSTAEIASQMLKLIDLQHQFFSANEQATLFADDNVSDMAALERREIVFDETLTRDAKKQLLAAHYAELSAQQMASIQPSIDAKKLTELQRKISKGEVGIDALGEQFDPNVVARSAESYQRRQAFQQDISTVKQALAALKTKQFEDPDAFNREKSALLARYFSENQQKRVRVILEHNL